MIVARFPFVKFPPPKDLKIPEEWQALLDRIDRLEAKQKK